MTHPDILTAERCGVLEPAAVARCAVCRRDIYMGEEYYDFGEIGGDIVCDGCDYRYITRFKREAWVWTGTRN